MMNKTMFSVFVLGSIYAQSAKAEAIKIGDILELLQLYMVIGGVFIAVIAALGIWVFGFDVRRTRNELDDVKKEVNEKKEAILELHTELINTVKDMNTQKEEFKVFINKTLSEMTKHENALKEFVEETESEIEQFVSSAQGQIDAIATDVYESVTPEGEKIIDKDDGADDLQAIKKVIEMSSFKWTSIKRVMSKTGLERQAILKLARLSDDIVISMGKKSTDHIFRLE